MRIKPLAWILLPVFILAGVVVAKLTGASSVGALTRDVVTAGTLPPLTGLVSTLGLLGWAVASSLAFFTSAILRYRSEQQAVRDFLLGAGVLSTLLYLDDAFLLHEALLPHWFGIPEHVTYAAYVLLLVILFVSKRRVVWRLSLPLLLAAGAAFSGSILADLFVVGTEVGILIEDGLKFVGITAWAVMLGDLAFRTLAEAKPSAPKFSPGAHRSPTDPVEVERRCLHAIPLSHEADQPATRISE